MCPAPQQLAAQDTQKRSRAAAARGPNLAGSAGSRQAGSCTPEGFPHRPVQVLRTGIARVSTVLVVVTGSAARVVPVAVS